MKLEGELLILLIFFLGKTFWEKSIPGIWILIKALPSAEIVNFFHNLYKLTIVNWL